MYERRQLPEAAGRFEQAVGAQARGTIWPRPV
jgi:hypothetical protein